MGTSRRHALWYLVNLKFKFTRYQIHQIFFYLKNLVLHPFDQPKRDQNVHGKSVYSAKKKGTGAQFFFFFAQVFFVLVFFILLAWQKTAPALGLR